MSFFSFVKRYTNLGVGTRDLGLRPRTTVPAGGSYMGGTGPRQWNIRRNLCPVNAPGFIVTTNAVVPVPLTGSFGLGVPGQLAMMPLVTNNNNGQSQ